MRITIVASSQDGLHQQALKDAAIRRGLDADIINLTPHEISTGKVSSKLGDVVIWRSSKLDLQSERSSLENLLQKKITISDAVFKYPLINRKYYQQQILRQDSETAKWSIPTFRYKKAGDFLDAVKEGLLTMPIIAKPNAGSRGEGIELINSPAEISKIAHIKDYVFQNFIPNNVK